MTPQILYIILSLIGIGITIEKHGKPKTGSYNVFTTVLSEAIVLAILYYGGFFTPLLEAIK